ncbi:hypothetical protein ES703_03916 [subsurface metagenome]
MRARKILVVNQTNIRKKPVMERPVCTSAMVLAAPDGANMLNFASIKWSKEGSTA